MSLSTTPIDTLARMEAHIAPTRREVHCTEEEIHQQMVSLSHLRADGNSFLPVFRLPLETLEIIFIHGARRYYESYNGGPSTPRIPTWVNVSYVCSHWRNIALSCSTLWTYHFNASLRWTEELLLRSKQASLKIRIYQSDRYPHVSWLRHLLDRLLEHSERIQELCLGVPMSSLPAKLSLCAPRLEKLEIKFRLYGRPMKPIAVTDGDKVPLHTLRLVGCSLPWYSLNLIGLKTLSLHHVHLSPLLNMAQFLSALGTMPNLAILDLEDVLPSSRSFISSGGLDISQKINLPCLTVLAASAPVSTVVTFLSCVNIPPRTRLDLEPLFEHGSTADDYTPISSHLAQQFGEQSLDATFRSLEIDFGDKVSLTFSLDCDTVSLSSEEDSDDPLRIALEVDEDAELADSDIHRIISNICLSLPLRNVQSLCVYNQAFSVDFWREILSCLDGLRYMMLSSSIIRGLSLLGLLSLTTHESDKNLSAPDHDPSPGHVFVPVLEELVLEYITFMPDDTSSRGGVSRRLLFDSLSTRRRIQDRIIVDECDFVGDPIS